MYKMSSCGWMCFSELNLGPPASARALSWAVSNLTHLSSLDVQHRLNIPNFKIQNLNIAKLEMF